ncbi:Protein of unknown function [Gryllus bimaculatus]|nr:Protein of unknown function [Gryllus bimaculatus]
MASAAHPRATMKTT